MARAYPLQRGSGVAMFLVALLVGGPAVAWGGTVHVEKYGTFTSTCGAVSDPCVSLSSAMLRAGPGDTVLVGPGIYTDLFDLHGTSLKILSRLGAGSVTLRPINGFVFIFGDHVTFGSPGKGFTVDGIVSVGGSNHAVAGN